MTSYSPETQRIFDYIGRFLPEMVAIRHDIHAHPELSYEEHRTAALVADLLKQWGYEVATGIGKTGVVGRLKVGDGTKSIGIRADFDALPLQEMTNLPYQSQYSGRMHACGHDGHTTMLLAAARYLSETKNFNGTLNLIFQPAEEGGAGAKAMIDDGLFKKFPVDAVFGMHNWPNGKLGALAARSGPFFAADGGFKLTIRGKGGHGASPDATVDPIIVGASIVQALQTVVSRNVSPLDSAVITVGSFQSGFAPNVIPAKAELLVTVRSYTQEVRALLRKRIEEVVTHQAQSFGAEVEFAYTVGYPALVNHPAQTDFALEVAERALGTENVDRNIGLVLGSEDFSYMLEECPGCYLLIGNGPCATIHSPHYDFNDDLIPIGGCYWARLTEEFLR